MLNSVDDVHFCADNQVTLRWKGAQQHAHSLAELARLYGGTGSKSLRFVSTRKAFFGNTLCLSNFRGSVNGRALATVAVQKLDRNSG